MIDYKGVLSDLEAKLVALDRERERLRIAVHAIRDIACPDGDLHSTTQIVSARDDTAPGELSGLTMPQAIERCLRSAERPLTKRQIESALRDGGRLPSSAKNPGAHVYNTLHRLSKDGGPFRRESDGRWGLSESAPGPRPEQ